MTFYKFKYDIINSRIKDMLNRRSAKYMKKLGLNEIRDLFLNFYERKEHFRRQSFSLIPKSDKSLLIINSGMAPLKAYFAGIDNMGMGIFDESFTLAGGQTLGYCI